MLKDWQAFQELATKFAAGDVCLQVAGLPGSARALVVAELLRAQGLTYKDIEDQGYFMVLTKLEVRYRRPAHYDDLLTLRTAVERQTSVRIDHRYELLRDGVVLAEGSSTLACVDRDGRVQALPAVLAER